MFGINCVFQDSDNMLSKIQQEANNHVNMILDSPWGEKILVVEFLRCIATKNPGSCYKQEDIVFVRLHRGYSDSNINEWVRSLFMFIHILHLQ